MTPRERLVEQIAEAIEEEDRRVNSRRDSRDQGPLTPREAAEVALRVIERPNRDEKPEYRICNCGQSGYPENSPFSNHPHRKGCPHYTGKRRR